MTDAMKKAAEVQAAAVYDNDRLRAETQAVLNGAKAWETYKAARSVSDDVMSLRKDLEDAGVAAEQINRLTAERQFLLENQAQAMAQLQQETALYDELEGIGTRAFDRIGAAVTEMMVQGKASAFDFKNVLLGVVSEIAQSFIQLAAINPLKNALFGTSAATLSDAGGFFGSLFSGSGSSISNGSAGGIRAPRPSSSLFGFADGGSMMVGPGLPSINAGRDNRMVSFAARDGERITVETPGQQRMQSAGNSGAGKVEMNFYNPTRDLIPDIIREVQALGLEVKQTKSSIGPAAVSAVVRASQRNPNLLGR